MDLFSFDSCTMSVAVVQVIAVDVTDIFNARLKLRCFIIKSFLYLFGTVFGLTVLQ